MNFFEFLAKLPLTGSMIGLGGAMIAAIIYIISLYKKQEISPEIIKAIKNNNQVEAIKLLKDKGINFEKISDGLSEKEKAKIIKQKLRQDYLPKMIIPVLVLILFFILLGGIIYGHYYVQTSNTIEKETNNTEQQEVQPDKITDVEKPKKKEEATVVIEPRQQVESETKEYIVTFSNTGAKKIIIDDGTNEQTIKNGIVNGTFTFNKVKSNTFKLYLYDENNKLIHDTDGYDFNLEKDTTVISFSNGKTIIR